MRKLFALALKEKSGKSISGAKVIGIMSSFMCLCHCTITLMLAEAIFEKRGGGFLQTSNYYYTTKAYCSTFFGFLPFGK